MLKTVTEYIHKMLQHFSRPQTYSSALEEYIVRNAPQTTCDVDRLTRQFDIIHSRRGW
jgi:hypothetical protein